MILEMLAYLQFKQGYYKSMFVWSAVARRTIPIIKNTFQIIKPSLVFKLPVISKWLILGAGLFLTMNHYELIEDEAIRNLRSLMNKEQNSLKSEYGQTTVYPEIKYELRGETYQIIFEIDQRKCDLYNLISIFMNVYNGEKKFKVVDMRAFNNKNISTWELDFEENDPKFMTPQKGRITLTGIMTNERPNFRLIFNKDGLITEKNQKALIDLYRQSVKPKRTTINTAEAASGFSKTNNAVKAIKKGSAEELIHKLTELGLTVFDPNNKTVDLDWDCLAGYENQKQMIEDTVLLALNYPQIYDQITTKTRVKYEANRPKAILFEGPPGTGKTTSAKIIAQQVNIPLIYIPTQAIMSKYYGQSETKLAQMWELCQKLGKVIIFIDQIDALAGNRDSDMHEASRRILSTLLRKIDSFESNTNVLLICATNRKSDLDAAMLSRIDLAINFSLPDEHSRIEIFRRYAKHLSDSDLKMLAKKTQSFSGRNINDICKTTERRWASKLIRKLTNDKLPTIDEYLRALEDRRASELK